MQQPFATETSAHSRENEIFAEHASMLDTALTSRQPAAGGRTGLPTQRRVVPLLLLVVVGAAVAFVPVAFKGALTTGRSVAADPSR